MRKKAPLMVVATLNPDSVSKEKLAKYTTPEGSFIANAGLEYVHSPFTGKVVKAAGVPVTATINGDNAVGVICRSCKAINATLDKSRSEIFCVTCGSHLSYDVNAETLDDDEVDDILNSSDDDDMIGGDDIDENDSDETSDTDDTGPMDDFMSEDDEETSAEDSEDDTDLEDDMDDVETSSDGDLTDNMDDEDDDMDNTEAESDDDSEAVDMTDVVDEDEDVAFVTIGENVAAISSGLIIASMPASHENASRVLSAGFNNAFKHSVNGAGLRKALVSAGFKVKRIVAPKVIAAATKKSSKQVDRLVKAGVDAKVKRFNECLEIAAAGGMIGMFGKEKANVLADALSEQFASMNIANSRKVARNVLSKVLAQHNNSIIKIATDLMKRDASVLSTYKEQIANMGGKIVAMDDQAEDDDETDYALESPESEESATIESRLERPMREARKPAMQTASVADGLKITGLFGKC